MGRATRAVLVMVQSVRPQRLKPTLKTNQLSQRRTALPHHAKTGRAVGPGAAPPKIQARVIHLAGVPTPCDGAARSGPPSILVVVALSLSQATREFSRATKELVTFRFVKRLICEEGLRCRRDNREL